MATPTKKKIEWVVGMFLYVATPNNIYLATPNFILVEIIFYLVAFWLNFGLLDPVS